MVSIKEGRLFCLSITLRSPKPLRPPCALDIVLILLEIKPLMSIGT